MNQNTKKFLLEIIISKVRKPYIFSEKHIGIQ